MSALYATLSVSLLPSAARTASADGSAVRTLQSFYPGTGDKKGWTRHGIFVLDVTASSGTSITLDVSIQGRTSTTGTWVTLPNGDFPRMTGNGARALHIDGPLLGEIRASATIAGTTPSFTFSVLGELGG